MKYQSPFTEKIEVNTPQEARQAILQFCSWYCKKDAIGKYHCPGCDSALCNAVKEQIVNDFKKP